MIDPRELPNVMALDGVAPDQVERYLQAELAKLRRNPMEYGYPLHSQQEKFVARKSRRGIVVAANRVGKTEGEMRDVLWCARGEHPYRRINMHSNIWVGSPDYPSYERFHKPTFDKWCPPEWIVGDFHETGRWVDIRRVDGGVCRISFLSYDMPRSKWQGAGVDGIWLDEECPEDIMNECLARIVTTRGWIILTFTPVEGIGWWYDRIWLPATMGYSNGWHAFSAALATYDEENEAECFVGESLVPHLTREQVIEFAREYPDIDELLIRVFGMVRGRQGLVYKRFSADVHVIPAFHLPAHWELWGGVDPGYHGFAASIYGMDTASNLFVVDEYFSQAEVTSVRFEALVEKCRALRTKAEWGDRQPVIVFFVDTEDPQTILELNTAAVAALEEDAARARNDPEWYPLTLAFASLEQGLKARKAGFLRVQQALQPRENRATPPQVRRPRPEDGEPQVYVFNTLYSEWQAEDKYHRESRFLWEIARYSWKKPPKGSTVKPDDADENSAGGAHMMATFRYVAMARLGPPEEQQTPSNRSHLRRHEREVYEDFEAMERRMLEEAGLV